jgi:hypothetical protein
VPVLSVLSLKDLIEGMKAMGRDEEVRMMEEYYSQYGTQD